MFLAIVALATAWDPVRPGALVRKIGDMIIVYHSVRVLLKFDNITVVRENVTDKSWYTDGKRQTGTKQDIQCETRKETRHYSVQGCQSRK